MNPFQYEIDCEQHDAAMTGMDELQRMIEQEVADDLDDDDPSWRWVIGR